MSEIVFAGIDIAIQAAIFYRYGNHGIATGI